MFEKGRVRRLGCQPALTLSLMVASDVRWLSYFRRISAVQLLFPPLWNEYLALSGCSRPRRRLKEQSFLIMKPLKILVSDIEWHSPFFQFVAMIFRGSEAERWQLWRDRGGWTERYEIFAILDGDRLVSTIGRTRMQLVVNGETRVGYQLGAVATLNSYRQQGLARQLMDWVIDGLD